MPNRPISFEFIADVAQYLREVKKMDVSTDDLADALVGVSESGDDLERKLSKAMRDAANDTEVLERAIKDVGTTSDRVGTEAKKDFDKVGSAAGEAGKEAGAEFAQNIGEGISSGDWSGAITGTLGGLAGAIPGGGIATAALGIGATIAGLIWQGVASNKQAVKEATTEILDAFDEITGALDLRAHMRQAFTELGGGDFATGLRDAAKYAEALNVSTEDYAALISGKVTPQTQILEESLRNQKAHLDELNEEQGHLSDSQYRQLDAINQTLGTTELERVALQQATDASNLWLDSTRQVSDMVGQVDVNMDGVIDATDEAALKLADTNADQLLSDTEISVANLGEILHQAGLIPDPGMPTTRADVDYIAGELGRLPRNIKISVDTEFNGGARALSGGGRIEVYTPKYPGDTG